VALFRNRVEAGRKLAMALADYKGKEVVVLGIPRGGVVVASEVARALGAPLDLVVTRKIEAPGEPEYALGAVTQEGDVIMDRQAAESLGASQAYLEDQIRKSDKKYKDLDKDMADIKADMQKIAADRDRYKRAAGY